MLLYEYPLNERIRTYLRLQELFDRLATLMGRSDAIDHHFALITLFELTEVAGRSELKTDVLKDLERLKQQYNAYRGNPAISEKTLDAVIAQIDGHFQMLNDYAGRIGQELSGNDFLNTIRSRAVIPGGTCEFDLPAYHAWKHQDAALRQADLLRWVEPYAALAQAVAAIMHMLRESGTTQKVMATQGQLQQSLSQSRAFQLLRVRIDPALGLIPEISCNRLLVAIRMLEQHSDGRSGPSTQDVPFEMSLCA